MTERKMQTSVVFLTKKSKWPITIEHPDRLTLDEVVEHARKYGEGRSLITKSHKVKSHTTWTQQTVTK